VPNHSSDENEWFQKSVKRIEPYTDYYVWHDGKIDPQTGKRVEPSNWVSYSVIEQNFVQINGPLVLFCQAVDCLLHRLPVCRPI